MEYRRLGRTGVTVSSLCLGAMMFGEWGTSDHEESIRIIHRALAAGVNFIDTADVYSAGESEVIVGEALKGGRRDDVVLASKVHMPMGDDPNQRGNSRRWIIREVENSLGRLGTDYLDLYQVHRYDPDTDLDETLGALSTWSGPARSATSAIRPGRSRRSWRPQWTARDRGRERFPPSSRPTRCSPARSSQTCCPRAPATDGRAVLQPAGRRMAVGPLPHGSRGAALGGAAAASEPVRHVAAREPAQAGSVRAVRGTGRQNGDHPDRAGDRVRPPPSAITSAIIGPRTMEHLESSSLPPAPCSARMCWTGSTRSCRPASRSTRPITAGSALPCRRPRAAAEPGQPTFRRGTTAMTSPRLTPSTPACAADPSQPLAPSRTSAGQSPPPARSLDWAR